MKTIIYNLLTFFIVKNLNIGDIVSIHDPEQHKKKFGKIISIIKLKRKISWKNLRVCIKNDTGEKEQYDILDAVEHFPFIKDIIQFDERRIPTTNNFEYDKPLTYGQYKIYVFLIGCISKYLNNVINFNGMKEYMSK